jgi:hypothetical protein
LCGAAKAKALFKTNKPGTKSNRRIRIALILVEQVLTWSRDHFMPG